MNNVNISEVTRFQNEVDAIVIESTENGVTLSRKIVFREIACSPKIGMAVAVIQAIRDMEKEFRKQAK